MMFNLTLMAPTEPLESLCPGVIRRPPWGAAVGEHETIRRLDIPHKEPLLFLQISLLGFSYT